ncbi:TPR-like protein [Glarea lozoyensis ATCC 20868]|uniref:TPR-like protein n=1 Tax=Glarea lozoyensis (strain ATCC 20868 / MF5171) TaxID=1116229 RepID=S3E2Y2_GLAL2|nr:TPR-like protein [Glarea lozoyensis ATCC 20868]EPE32773.1 TPR-like protein [Glarea lozoyensis ATCC 20868]
MSSEEESSILREEGNALYKSGDLSEAISKYRQAAKITPNDPAPYGNLSAAYLEVGQYRTCRLMAERALMLRKQSDDFDEASPQVLKLQQRIVKANAHDDVATIEDQRACRIKLMKEVPRYRPKMNTSLEFYHVGHDQAFNMYNSATDKMKEGKLFGTAFKQNKAIARNQEFIPDPKEELVSFFLAGVGDARNMFRTIIGISDTENTDKKSYHFTINDINKSALARDIVVVMLVEELMGLEKGTDEYLEVLSTIYFVYVAVIIPQYALDKMQATISKALNALESRQQPSKLLHLYERHYAEYLKVLKSWQGEALTVLTTKEVFKLAKQQVSQMAMMIGDALDLPPKCKAERNLYLTSLVLQPPKRMLQKYDPIMLKELQDCANRPQTNTPRLKCRDYLLENWKVNTTMVDVEWYASLGDKDSIDFGHDPFEAAVKFTDEDMKARPPAKPQCLYDYVSTFFSAVADAFGKLGGRLKVEVLLGDCVDVAEQLRFDLFSSEDGLDSGNTPEVRPKYLPNSFDCVHLSNVPDYMNGNLSTCLYFAPLLNVSPISCVLATCLYNSSSWPTLESFHAEYQLIHNKKMLEQLTRVGYQEPMYNDSRPMADYIIYDYLHSRPFHFNDLLPKTQFLKWLYALFFRIVLPFNTNLHEQYTIILSPCTTSIFFRLLAQLRTIGYPSHWLSEAVTAILTSKITTTARPPRASPTTTSAAKREHAPKRLSTAPFVHETSVLAKQFAPLLPFKLAPEILPKSISRYTFPVTKPLSIDAPVQNVAALTLLFWDPKALSEGATREFYGNARRFLDPSWGEVEGEGETEAGGKGWKEVREKLGVFGGVVLEGGEGEAGKREGGRMAKVWLDDEVVERMKFEGWVWALFGVASWAIAGEVGRVEEGVRGERWV